MLTHSASTDGSPRLGRELLTAWLLALLSERATYGYRLGAAFDARGLGVDRGGMYRTLRTLEGYGWVQSRWFRPDQGPRRRLYRVTPRGRRALDEIALMIAAVHERHEALLRAYEQPVQIVGSGGLAPPAPVAGALLRPPRKLLAAWLLLFLRRGESHGYALGQLLAEQGLSVEPSVLYRTLRTLEQDASVTSHWGETVAGPRRRLYALTDDGADALDELVEQIRAVSGCMEELLRAHRRERPHGLAAGEESCS